MEIFRRETDFLRRYFYPLTSDILHYSADTPVADMISKGILCLPMYASLEEEVYRIVKLIKDFHEMPGGGKSQ